MDMTTTKEFDRYAKNVGGSLTDELSAVTGGGSRSMSHAPTVYKGMKNPGLPQDIYESIMENPLNAEPESELDELFSKGKLIRQPDTLNESRPSLSDYVPRQQPAPQQAPVQSMGVDYSLIRMIVEDVVNKKMEQMSRQMLNESKSVSPVLSTLRIRENKLNFLTADGDLYEAELKFVKNVRNNKKKQQIQ